MSPAFPGSGDRIVLPSGRTSRLAKPSFPWNATQQPGGLPSGYSCRQLAVEQPWVSVAVNGMARQMSRLPLKVYRRTTDGSRDRDRDGEAARRLARPGLRRSAAELKYSVACGLLIDGNHVEEKVTLADSTPGLRTLDWRFLVPYVLEGEVIGWEYRHPDLATPRAIDVDDVIHYRWSGYRDGGPLGVSPLEHLGITMRTEQSAQRWGESNFRNGARPGVAIVMNKDVKASQADREALRDEFETRYVGEDNAGRPMVLGGGVEDVKSLGQQTPVEAGLIDVRKLNRVEVLAVYNWPPPVAGDLENGSYSNVTELNASIFKIVLPPWTNLVGEQTTSQLIGGPDPSAHYAEFDYAEAMRGDLVQRVNAYKIAHGSGQMTLNQIQEAENRPRIEDPLADELFVPTNNLAPLSQVIAKAADTAGGGDPVPDEGGRPPADETGEDQPIPAPAGTTPPT